ncbi:uncharacterized protein LOC112513777 [Cynara cardunculus var. scolymus]|uniref:uncharacterized protein LOC112513777 n=1 Tax=Cynara cardunculus var. scolymus TaxID=59895 RepID=UPI000D626822|nr:uncharacterized protein LOC112513777 [Cynara cardunculus var. scolymus]
MEEERIGSKRGRDDEKGNMGRLEKRASGMVVVEEYSGDEMINGVKYEEEKISDGGGGGGLFNQLITNLVNSPKSNQQLETDHVFQAGSEKNSGGGAAAGGGVINDFISNIFNSSGGGGGEEVVENGGEVVEKGDGGGDVVEKGGGGKIIDNVVSQLPRTLSEDAVPATDEASILLHSIIHD